MVVLWYLLDVLWYMVNILCASLLEIYSGIMVFVGCAMVHGRCTVY